MCIAVVEFAFNWRLLLLCFFVFFVFVLIFYNSQKNAYIKTLDTGTH